MTQHKKERDKRVADRIKVVLLTDDGWTIDEIRRALFIDDGTVRRHLDIYKEEHRLKPNHKGSDPLLNREESARLSTHLEANLYKKVKEIQAYIRKTYHKELSQTAVYEWLKKNGFTYKKPKLIPAKADPEAQAAFISTYEKMMTQAAIEDSVVLFGDAVHPSQQTRASYGWVKKGQERVLETHSGRKRVNLMGVLNLETMDFVRQDYETINGQAAIAFLQKIEDSYPQDKKIYLIWDRAGYHTCQAVKDYLKTSRINVQYLPPHSPNLNAIERLWKIMHRYVSNNRCYEKFSHFKEALFEFFDVTMGTIFEELVSSVTDNFRVIGSA